MAIARLIADGVGPFEHLDLNFCHQNGKPHLGPHILAGVNGSGKSTVLRTLAWAADFDRYGFPGDEWMHFLSGRPVSRAMAVIRGETGDPRAFIAVYGSSRYADLDSWLADAGISSSVPARPLVAKNRPRYLWWEVPESPPFGSPPRPLFAAYAPSRALRYLKLPNPMVNAAEDTALAFDGAVQNDAIQAWMLNLHTKRALAKERSEPSDSYSETLGMLEKALTLVCGGDVRLEVDIEPILQPLIRWRDKRLSFSQLPDGVRNTVGWLADFMMRRDSWNWSPDQRRSRPSVLLLDEIDAHLHPRWQRTLLPAMREALPDVQIIVSTHSPFVINSCPGSRVHVLDLDERGNAFVRESIDAPIGSSITSTIKDIFDVDSRFDYYTEQQLKEWNDLKRKEEVEDLSQRERTRIEELTELLAMKSEELRLIVTTPPKLSRTLMEALSKR